MICKILFFFYSFFFFVYSAESEFNNFSNVYCFGAETTSTYILKNDVNYLDLKNRKYNHQTFSNVFFENYNDTLIIILVENPILKKIELQNVKHTNRFFKILRKFKCFVNFFYSIEDLYYLKYSIKITYAFYYNLYENSFKLCFVFNIKQNIFTLYFFFYSYEINLTNFFFCFSSNFQNTLTLFRYFFFYKKKYFSYNRYTRNISLKNVLNFIHFLKEQAYLNSYFNFIVYYFYVITSLDLRFNYIFAGFDSGKRFLLNTILFKSCCFINLNFLHSIFKENFYYMYFFSLKKILQLKIFISYILRKIGFFSNFVYIKFFLKKKYKFIDVKFLIFCNKRLVIKNFILSGNTISKNNHFINLKFLHVNFFSHNIDNFLILKKNYVNFISYFLQRKMANFFTHIDTIVININEKKIKNLSGTISYNFHFGFLFSISADFINFLGSEKNLKFFLEKNFLGSEYNVQYFNPYFLKNFLGFGINFFQVKKSLLMNIEKIQKKKANINTFNSGFELFLLFSIFKHSMYFKLGYLLTILKYFNYDLSTDFEKSRFLSYNGLHYRDFYISLEFDFNSLKRISREDCSFSQSLKFYSSLPYSDLKYVQCIYSMFFYKYLIFDYILGFSLTFYIKKIYSNTILFPFLKEIYFNKYLDSKGFKDCSLESKFLIGEHSENINYQRSQFFLTNRILLILPKKFFFEFTKVQNSVFIDFAYILKDYYFYTYNEKFFPYFLKSSFGFSLMWYSPIDIPLELCFSLPILKKDDDLLQYFSFSIGTG